MTGIAVHTSHRLEDLAAALAERLLGEPLPPLAAETIVVPTRGIARWLELELAQRHGIAAGLRFPFPGAFLAELAAGTSERAATPDPFAPELLQLRLFRLLGDAPANGPLALAAAYCRDDPDGMKRFQLAERLAAVFDDYQLYRSDLLARAADGDDLRDQGAHGPWQAALWRLLLADAGLAPRPKRRGKSEARTAPTLWPELGEVLPPPAAHRSATLRARLADPAGSIALPSRVTVFGAGSLPPAFVELLRAIAQRVPVHLYVPLPTPHWFGDQRPRDHEGGNPLLARFGTLAREFAEQLANLEEPGDVPCERVDLAPMPDPDAEVPSLLACLQRDVAAVLDRSAEVRRFRVSEADESLLVHDCHSPQRELEVVRDRILAAFDADPTLEPHDVLVLVPDIATYAPYAEAVFGPVRAHLPFQVADRDPASELPLCASVLSVLELAQGRLAVFDVLHLLEQPSVLRRFGLATGEVSVLRQWCARAGIRWGIDGAMRERQFQVPAFEENSWTHGLERLLLGVAAGPGDELVLGRLPVADATSSRDGLLERFLGFLRALFAQLPALQRSHAAAGWADAIDELCTALHEPADGDDQLALQRLARATADLRALAEAAALREPLSPSVLREWLRQHLGRTASGRGFLGGAVTVAAMQPMRTVPVRHLYLCGLSDRAFPRRDQPAPFDLIASKPRHGDRSVRNDDRQLFLDALMAARERLHLTFVGRSQKDESPCAPSVAIAELLDLVDRTCTAVGRERPRDAILVHHPLQPWSRRYRDGSDPRLFTFARGDAPGTPVEPAPAPVFAAEPVEPPAELLGGELPFAVLATFWHHPCRYFVREVLGLRFPRDDGDEFEDEPFEIGSLDKWRLQDPVVQAAQRGDPPPPDPLAHARATGMVPPGGLGAFAWMRVQAETESFLADMKARWGDGRASLAVRVGDVVVSGEIDGIGPEGAVRARIAKLKPKDRLRAWLQHVWVAAARARGRDDLPERTVILARDRAVTLKPLDGALALQLLERFVAGYHAGLRAPLPWFENSTFAYAKALRRDAHAAALHKARAQWLPDTSGWGPKSDCEDDAIDLCMRGRDALALPGFAEWAEAIWRPYWDHAGEK